MPAPRKGPRLGSGPAHERLLLANLAAHLFEAGAITTTVAKAKALRPYAERLITKAKRGGVHQQRVVDARRSACWRAYRYAIVNRPVPDPFLARYAWWVPTPLDLDALRLGADPFVGEHDFAAFCRKGPEGSTTTRRVYESRWHDLGGGVLRYDVRAAAFCWQMVRAIVGTLVDVGTGKKRPGDLMAILRSRDRADAGQLAPPHGLCLWQVGY